MSETTTVEVSKDAKNAAQDAIETLPRDQRPTTKDFATEALIQMTNRLLKDKRFTRSRSNHAGRKP